MTKGSLKRREQWRPVLDAEVERWSGKSCERLTTELADVQAYEVVFNGKNYFVEVELLENTDKYLHVGLSVDDCTIPASFRPLSTSFICKKNNGEKRIANDQ